MAKSKTWGDHISLVGIAESRQLSIVVFSSHSLENGYEPFITIEPSRRSKRSIFIFHEHEFHYESLRPLENEGHLDGLTQRPLKKPRK
jgi:hypothetical protein